MDNIKLVITDIDGVWTDGGMFYDNHGNEWKKFSVYDGWGVRILNELKIPLVIITGENSPIVTHRAKKLKIEHVFLGISDKLKVANELCKKFDISLNNIAFIGDEFNDLPLLKVVGISACPAQSASYIKNNVNIVLTKKGGEGVFKEFVETIFNYSFDL